MTRSRCVLVALFSMLSVFWVGSALAAWDSQPTNVTIKDVTVLTDGSFYIYTDTQLCTYTDPTTKIQTQLYTAKAYVSYTVNGAGTPTEQGKDRMLSTALAAFLGKHKVKVFVDNSDDSVFCKLGAIQIF